MKEVVKGRSAAISAHLLSGRGVWRPLESSRRSMGIPGAARRHCQTARRFSSYAFLRLSCAK